MKRFLLRILLLAMVMFVADRLAGFAIEYMMTHTKGGDTGRLEFIANQMDDDLLIFGSSRAVHHYDTMLLEDSLGLSVYNCGLDGQGIIYNYGQYMLIKDRYRPQAIIYDLEHEYDQLNTTAGNEQFLGSLMPYYDRRGIDSLFYKVSPTERLKMIPYMRRYNSRFIKIASDYIKPQQSNVKGYKPIDVTMEYEPILTVDNKKEQGCDPIKLYYWQRFIDDTKANDIKLILLVSPVYHGGDIDAFSPIIELAERNDIPFVSYYNDQTIKDDRTYFVDQKHLNKSGAERFTAEIVDTLRFYLQGIECK